MKSCFIPSSSQDGRRAVFLDRDGCINAMVYLPDFGLVDSPQNPDQFQLLPGAAEAIRLINQMGFLAVVVSNQPGIAKDKCTPALLEAVTQKMHRELERAGARLDGVYYCLHHPEAVIEAYRAACACRKPRPGLLQQAAGELNIDPSASFMVGDGLTDVLAGKAVGCSSIYIGNQKPEHFEMMRQLKAFPDNVATGLPEAVALIRSGSARGPGSTAAAGKAPDAVSSQTRNQAHAHRSADGR